jgi:hypothetical protein
MTVTRIDAARRLIRFAIKGYINGEEELAVHLAAQSAFRVCRDLVKKDNPQRDLIALVIKEDKLACALSEITEVNNFLKHAERGAKGRDEIDVSHIADFNEMLILQAILYFEAASGEVMRDYFMFLFHLLQFKRSPELFHSGVRATIDGITASMDETEILRLMRFAFTLNESELARITAAHPALKV